MKFNIKNILNFKNPLTMVAVGMVIAMFYLFFTQQISQQAFIILSAVAVVAYAWSQSGDKFITIEEAEMIAMKELDRLQTNGNLSNGRLVLTGEEKLTFIVYENGKIEPDKWFIKVRIDSDPPQNRVIVILPNGKPFGTFLVTEGWTAKTLKDYEYVKGQPSELKKESDKLGVNQNIPPIQAP